MSMIEWWDMAGLGWVGLGWGVLRYAYACCVLTSAKVYHHMPSLSLHPFHLATHHWKLLPSHIPKQQNFFIHKFLLRQINSQAHTHTSGFSCTTPPSDTGHIKFVNYYYLVEQKYLYSFKSLVMNQDNIVVPSYLPSTNLHGMTMTITERPQRPKISLHNYLAQLGNSHDCIFDKNIYLYLNKLKIAGGNIMLSNKKLKFPSIPILRRN